MNETIENAVKRVVDETNKARAEYGVSSIDYTGYVCRDEYGPVNFFTYGPRLVQLSVGSSYWENSPSSKRGGYNLTLKIPLSISCSDLNYTKRYYIKNGKLIDRI